MTAYRVLVVDDSAFMRKILCDLIAKDPQFDIVATATNGCEAIEAAGHLKPDVITMDLEMPEMNGLEALKRIMRAHPTPVIMLSSLSDDGMRETISALQYGAFDFIRKPSGPLSPDIHQVGEQLLEKLRVAVLTKRPANLPRFREQPAPAAVVKPAAQPRPQKPAGGSAPKPAASRRKTVPEPDAAAGRKEAAPAPQALPPQAVPQPLGREAVRQEPSSPPKRSKQLSAAGAFTDLVVIGTSTGGPRALHEVITGLPGDFPAPVLIVQHMPPRFTRSLAQRLDSFSSLRVTEAEDGQRVQAGTVYLAPGGYHMVLARDEAGYSIKLSLEPPRGGHRPSVDVLFESCAPYPELTRHSVIMTGMGNDGVKGMKALNDSGGASAIAEAEESCIVFGMPRCAIEAGIAKAVVPLRDIASALVEAVMK